MNISVTCGDVLCNPADILISSANPWLNMSGGVNGAILERCPEIQAELHSHLKSLGKSSVAAGTVVQSSTGSLPFDHLLHAVAIDPFYESSHELVCTTLTNAFELAKSLRARTIALPALATGYGPMTMQAFANALAESLQMQDDFDAVQLVVRKETDLAEINLVLQANRRS